MTRTTTAGLIAVCLAIPVYYGASAAGDSSVAPEPRGVTTQQPYLTVSEATTSRASVARAAPKPRPAAPAQEAVAQPVARQDASTTTHEPRQRERRATRATRATSSLRPDLRLPLQGDVSLDLHAEPSEPNDVFLQLNGPARPTQNTTWRARTPVVLGHVTIGERGSAPLLWEVQRPDNARRLTVGARPIRGGGLIALEATLDR